MRAEPGKSDRKHDRGCRRAARDQMGKGGDERDRGGGETRAIDDRRSPWRSCRRDAEKRRREERGHAPKTSDSRHPRYPRRTAVTGEEWCTIPIPGSGLEADAATAARTHGTLTYEFDPRGVERTDQLHQRIH